MSQSQTDPEAREVPKRTQCSTHDFDDDVPPEAVKSDEAEDAKPFAACLD